MEKQRKIRKIKFCPRLLKNGAGRTALLLCLSLQAFLQAALYGQQQQRLTYKRIMELSVVPVNETNFSGSDCAFELKIPYTKSDAVRAQIPDLPQGVSFVSLRRSEYSDEEDGTKIELWLNFASSGTYRIRFLHVYINNRLYNIPFEPDPVVIYENPRNILPQLVLDFDSGTEAVQSRTAGGAKVSASAKLGSPVTFVVSLKYAVQIVSYDWSVPKNALLTELTQYEITKGMFRSSEFSEEKIPVAKFEWTPLFEGAQYLPDVRITATSYNGRRVELSLPDILVQVTDMGFAKEKLNDYSSYFGYAFNAPRTAKTGGVKTELSLENCQRIAQLRQKERHSIPFTSAYKERTDFEKQCGIAEGGFEPSFLVLYVSLGCMAFFLLFSILFAALKKKLRSALCSGFFIVFLSVSVIFGFALRRSYGIFTGGEIRSVPEHSVDSFVSVERGRRVLIEQRAGDWLFISYGNSGGWVTSSSVIEIKN